MVSKSITGTHFTQTHAVFDIKRTQEPRISTPCLRIPVHDPIRIQADAETWHTRAHTEKRYLLISQACASCTIFIFKCTVGEVSTLLRSRCCRNKYFILEPNCILWP